MIAYGCTFLTLLTFLRLLLFGIDSVAPYKAHDQFYLVLGDFPVAPVSHTRKLTLVTCDLSPETFTVKF